jgi:hypothetical protein
MTNPKIADQHLSRQAYVYVRQSTPGQVRFNQESAERQYNLAGKAQSLGWSPERIRTLDRLRAQLGKCLMSSNGRVGTVSGMARRCSSNIGRHDRMEVFGRSDGCG